jgi:nucleotide-binding universal stress UspA family protein
MGEQLPFRHVLVAAGRSADARAALQMAVRVAQATGGEVTLLGVAQAPLPVIVPEPSPSMPEAPDSYARETALVEQLAREELDAAQAAIGETVPCRTVLCWGPPGPAIVEEAQKGGHDVVVIALRKRGELGRLLRDHAEHHVLRHSPIPVVVVPCKDLEKT